MNGTLFFPANTFLSCIKYCDITSPRTTYILRALLAANLALVAAYWLELDMPYSAASTVLLVLNPVQGAVLGKGKWRLIGTLMGMVAALAFMAAFAQQPWLFAIADSLWLGACVMAMSVLRHFRASGAAVAGYTIGLATLGAMQHPELAFEHAVGRASTVALGVMSLGLVSALFSRRSLSGKVTSQLWHLTQQTARMSAEHDRTPLQRQLLAELYGVDDLLAAARQESPLLAQQTSVIRQVMDLLLVNATMQVSTQYALWQQVNDRLERGPSHIPAAQVQLRAALDTETFPPNEQLLVENLLHVLTLLSSLERVRVRQSPPPVAFHRDWRGAWRNGLRAATTLLAASALWIGSGWSDGDIMLLVIAPYFALLSTALQPAAGARKFLLGTLFALPMALICAFVLLPLINGLPLLLIVLSLFWLPGIYATSMPQHMLSGLAYLVGFNTLTAASNPMVYDAAQFLNWSLAWLLGTAGTLLAFQLMPRRPERQVVRLQKQIRHNLVALLSGKKVSATRWQQHQQHRLAQLVGLLRAQPEQQQQAMQQGLLALNLGRAWLALPHAIQTSQQQTLITLLQQRIARRAQQPSLAAKHMARAARTFAKSGDNVTLIAHLTSAAQLLQAMAAGETDAQ
ncbi:FUSC family protein [Candidatus Pantoea formicae]|uniref:FUSC family protein n=1 Tax=Candidatus Pantoea formicae TaxID=2608355 RepID=UPI003ED91380